MPNILVFVHLCAQRRVHDAEDLKSEGNDHFRAGRWDEAVVAYRSALGQLPRRVEVEVRRRSESGTGGRVRGKDKGKGREVDAPFDEEEDVAARRTSPTPRNEDASAEGGGAAEEDQELETPPSELEVQCAKLRAALHANVGACFVRLVRPCSLSSPYVMLF